MEAIQAYVRAVPAVLRDFRLFGNVLGRGFVLYLRLLQEVWRDFGKFAHLLRRLALQYFAALRAVLHDLWEFAATITIPFPSLPRITLPSSKRWQHIERQIERDVPVSYIAVGIALIVFIGCLLFFLVTISVGY